MDSKDKLKEEDSSVNVNFESHPPIESDTEPVARLLRQTLLHFVDCQSIAEQLIKLKDITQVIAIGNEQLGDGDEKTTDKDEEDDDEPDDDIYGVTSVINLNPKDAHETTKQLIKFLESKFLPFKELREEAAKMNCSKFALIINERYINLPPQLALPTLQNLTKHLEDEQYSHIIFVIKILLKSQDRSNETKVQNKKAKISSSSSSQKKSESEPIIFVNPEEEIIFEASDQHADFDVSGHCDENATWSFSNETKYTPHRRILIINRDKWPEILRSLDNELK